MDNTVRERRFLERPQEAGEIRFFQEACKKTTFAFKIDVLRIEVTTMEFAFTLRFK